MHTRTHMHACAHAHAHTHTHTLTTHTHTHSQHTRTLTTKKREKIQCLGWGWEERTPGARGDHSPIFTGNPAGSCKVIKSRSLAKWALLVAIRSMIGKTCSCNERGKSSHSHSVALNFWILVDCSMGRPMSRSPRLTSALKYSSGVMDEGL